MQWPNHPFVSPATCRRLFKSQIKSVHVTDKNDLSPGQFIKLFTRSGAMNVSCTSHIEEDDVSEENDYRQLKIEVEYDASKPYSRYRAGRIASLMQQAVAAARAQNEDALSYSESVVTLPVFFGTGSLRPTPPKTHIPGLYKQDKPWEQRVYPIPNQR